AAQRAKDEGAAESDPARDGELIVARIRCRAPQIHDQTACCRLLVISLHRDDPGRIGFKTRIDLPGIDDASLYRARSCESPALDAEWRGGTDCPAGENGCARSLRVSSVEAEGAAEHPHRAGVVQGQADGVEASGLAGQRAGVVEIAGDGVVPGPDEGVRLGAGSVGVDVE